MPSIAFTIAAFSDQMRLLLGVILNKLFWNVNKETLGDDYIYLKFVQLIGTCIPFIYMR